MKHPILASLLLCCTFGVANTKNDKTTPITDEKQESTLVTAVKTEDITLVEILLEKQSINTIDPGSGTHILILAVDLQNPDLVETIMAAETIKQRIPDSVFIDAYELSKQHDNTTIKKLLWPKVSAIKEKNDVHKLAVAGLITVLTPIAIVYYIATFFGIDIFKTKSEPTEDSVTNE